ncbi:hypothetical protein H1R20_g11057, partial [Candolleomyces eurysporus]
MFHSANKSFSLGDAGIQGFQGFFAKHKCNKICAALGLPFGQGCNGATIDEARIKISIGHGVPLERKADDVSNVSAVDLPPALSGQVELEPLNEQSIQTLIYSPDSNRSFELAGYLCHPAKIQNDQTGSITDWTIFLKNDVRGLVLDAQDAAFYKYTAHTAGANGFLEEYVRKLGGCTSIMPSVKGINLLTPSLLKPVEDRTRFRLKNTPYLLLTAIDSSLPRNVEIQFHSCPQRLSEFQSNPRGPASIPSNDAAVFLEAFSHYVFEATSGGAVVTDFDYFIDDGYITILGFNHPTQLVNDFAKLHQCNDLCRALNLPSFE